MLINDVSIGLPISGIKFAYNVDGFGERGLSIGTLEFDVYDKYDTIGDMYLQGMSAVVIEENNAVVPSKPYYLSQRSINNHVVHFTAFDITSKTDKTFDIPYIPPDTAERKGTIEAGGVMEAIKIQCGFASVSYTAAGDEMLEMKFTRDMLEGKTCRQLMETIAENSCGTWVASDDGGIILIGLGYPYGATITAEKYAAINRQGKQKITMLIITDTESGEITTYETGEPGTVIAIETPFPQVGAYVWGRIMNYEYSAWKCDKALIDPFAPDSHAAVPIMLGDEALAANSFSLSLDSTGIYFSGGCNPQDESAWRYQDYLNRELDYRLKKGKTMGNIQVDDTSFMFVNKNKGTSSSSARSGDTAVEKYRFDVHGGGFVESEAVMSSKKEAENVVIDTDANTVDIQYKDGHALHYAANVSKSGNRYTLSNEVVTWE